MTDQPAFPTTYAHWTEGKQWTEHVEGMTLRQWFAGQALAGMIKEGEKCDTNSK